MRLSVGRLLDEAWLEDVRRDSGLYVALWRGGADAWRREQAVRPLTPQALGSHALLVAMHPEGVEVVFGTRPPSGAHGFIILEVWLFWKAKTSSSHHNFIFGHLLTPGLRSGGSKEALLSAPFQGPMVSISYKQGFFGKPRPIALTKTVF